MNDLVNFEQLVEEYQYDIPDLNLESSDSNDYFSFEKVDKKRISQCFSRKQLKEFKLLHLDFLSKIRDDGFPVFAVFNIGQDNCKFYGSIDQSGYISVDTTFNSKCLKAPYTEVCRQLFLKVLKQTKKISHIESLHFSLSTEFQGILSNDSRDKIRNNLRKFDEIVVIAEAEKWTFDQTVIQRPPNPDPLIVGIKDGLAYLIGTFNMTRVENYISKEFTE